MKIHFYCKGVDNIKYVGSKTRIAKDIVPIIQKYIEDNSITEYYECFCGGCNIIDKIKCKNKYASDSNEYLIAFWQALQQGWNPLEITMTKELYDDIKSNKDKYSKQQVALAGLCATYNAKWFGGYAGIVHTKIGTERNYYDEAVRNVLKQVPFLKDATFSCSDYTNITPPHNSLIYCDPPYQDTTKYKGSIDYNVYWNWVREMSKNNIVLCSEYNAPSDFECIWSKELTTTLDKASRSTAVEKLFIYKGVDNN